MIGVSFFEIVIIIALDKRNEFVALYVSLFSQHAPPIRMHMKRTNEFHHLLVTIFTG